jgi:hypothetical protein
MRQYTGNRDGDHGKARPGLVEFVKTIEQITDGALWNNGTYANRSMRGKESLSVHATGRAVDLSWRKLGNKGRRNGKAVAEWLCDVLAEHADTLGVECILDYCPKPFGRGWRCDRDGWVNYKTLTIHGAPSGDWLHVELSPRTADSPTLVREGWSDVAETGVLAKMPNPRRNGNKVQASKQSD